MQTVQVTEGQQRKPQPVLDDETLLTSAQVTARCGNVSNMTIWRWQRDARVQFPPPDVVINTRRYWYVRTIRRWQAERMTKAAA
jgi:hypothetical protein